MKSPAESHGLPDWETTIIGLDITVAIPGDCLAIGDRLESNNSDNSLIIVTVNPFKCSVSNTAQNNHQETEKKLCWHSY